jgi:hypothetical protein
MDIIIDAAFGIEDTDGKFLQECLNFFKLVDSKPKIIKLTCKFVILCMDRLKIRKVTRTGLTPANVQSTNKQITKCPLT